MPLELTPLEPERLSDALRRVVGPQSPPALKLMAARGLAPLGPQDLITALYQVGLETDATLAEAAQKSAAGLPERVLQGGLAGADDARVLHYFARLVKGRPEMVELVLLNRNTHDDTFAYLAGVCDERELEMIAAAEERCLRTPAIVEALYFNRRARMSTVDRLVELCARHGVELDKIPGYREIIAALSAAPQVAPEEPEVAALEDDIFREAIDAGADAFGEGDSDETDETVGELLEGAEEEARDPKRVTIESIKNLKLSAKIRLATVGTAFHRAVLIRDSNKQVALAAIRSPAVSDNEVARYSANRALAEDVVRYIASRREYLKNYQVKVNLVSNPKCPLATAMRLLQFLRENDLRGVARSKSIPAALATTAKKQLANKKSG
ncbi:MAG TPA: hypothetical protein VGQ83_33250 [Polyangia bacterium]|jgi:hypothetical protein